ncbi:MAG: hypothetical protein HUJ73_07895 [Eubacterium sp.]|nr:hypothetical protein [Eubacterium sp.]
MRQVPAGGVLASESPEASLQKSEKKPEPVRKAAPEDLKEIAGRWNQIVSQTEFVFRAVLSKIGSPKYDSSTGESKLYLETQDPFTKDILNDPENKEKLREAISEVLKKELAYEIVVEGPSHGKQLDKIPVDEVIAREITIPVTEIS